jgi:DHA1 family inner membrane transport protein
MAGACASAVGSALADTYATLLAARLGSALAQALFMAVASQVAMSVVAPEKQTAAVAKVFNGFAVATVAGLPLGTLVGHAYGWHATFVLVAVLSGAGFVGVVAFCPPVPHDSNARMRGSAVALVKGPSLAGFAITLFALTGFVAAFTYVAPMLREVTGLSPGWVSLALVVYGAGTIAGNLLAGRVPPGRIGRLLPAPLGALTVILLAQAVLLHNAVAAVVGLFLLGTAAFVIVPLVQTWLMGRVEVAGAGLAAAVNISVAGLAGAAGAGLGGAVLSAGWGLAAIGPVAAIPALLATAASLGVWRAGRQPSPVDNSEPARNLPVDSVTP